MVDVEKLDGMTRIFLAVAFNIFNSKNRKSLVNTQSKGTNLKNMHLLSFEAPRKVTYFIEYVYGN